MGKRSTEDSRFNAAALFSVLFDEFGFSPDQKFVVAYSGGVDSTALLVAMAGVTRSVSVTEKPALMAIHFNHQIDPEADNWQRHCKMVCEQLGVSFQWASWTNKPAGNITEGEARKARYQWFQEVIEPDQVLLTAHHSDDQAETVLLNLVQGRDFSRVSGIPPIRPLSYGDTRIVCRPLLKFPRSLLDQFLVENGKHWIDDPANHGLHHERNFIRHQVIPLLQQRWPGVNRSITHSAEEFTRIHGFLDDSLDGILQQICHPAAQRIHCLATPIKMVAIPGPEIFKGRLVIRHWVHQAGYRSPSDSQIAVLLDQIQVRSTKQWNGKNCQIAWDDLRICGQGEYLYLLRQRPPAPPAPVAVNLQSERIHSGLFVQWHSTENAGLSPTRLKSGRARWLWRTGGEKLILPGRAHRSRLKKLYQEYGIPQWERDGLPTLEIDGQIAWVNGIGVSRDFLVSKPETEKVIPVFGIKRK